MSNAYIKYISATTAVTTMVHLSKFAEFYEESNQIIAGFTCKLLILKQLQYNSRKQKSKRCTLKSLFFQYLVILKLTVCMVTTQVTQFPSHPIPSHPMSKSPNIQVIQCPTHPICKSPNVIIKNQGKI